MRKTHANFVITKCATIINKKCQFLHATPDFLCECDCCGQGCGEVKCPYCIDGVDFDSYVQKKSSCLQKNESCFQLKRDHDYYCQAQQQIHTSWRGYLDFIVFASDGQTSKFFLERLAPDMKHWETQIPKLEEMEGYLIIFEVFFHPMVVKRRQLAHQMYNRHPLVNEGNVTHSSLKEKLGLTNFSAWQIKIKW